MGHLKYRWAENSYPNLCTLQLDDQWNLPGFYNPVSTSNETKSTWLSLLSCEVVISLLHKWNHPMPSEVLQFIFNSFIAKWVSKYTAFILTIGLFRVKWTNFWKSSRVTISDFILIWPVARSMYIMSILKVWLGNSWWFRIYSPRGCVPPKSHFARSLFQRLGI